MTGPPLNQDDIFAKAKQLRDAGVPLPEIDKYLQSKLGAPPADDAAIHAARLAKARAIQAEPDDSGPSYAQQALGGIAAIAADIPGAEAAQAYARSKVQGESYSDALSEIHQAEDAAPKWVRRYNKLAGGLVTAAALPELAEKAAGSGLVQSLPQASRIASIIRGAASTPLRQGASYGAASGLLQADPRVSKTRRLVDAGIGATVGAATGRLGENATTAVRSLLATPLDRQALARQAEIAATDATNYGKVEAEGRAAGGTSPEIQRLLNNPSPTLAPYVREVTQNSESTANASDAQKLVEAYKLLSERQGALQKRIVQAAPTDFKAGSALERRDIGAVKGALQSAAAMPTRVTRPPLTLDVAPEDFATDPQITPEREPVSGPPATQPRSLREAIKLFEAAKQPNDVSGPAFQLGRQPARVVPGVQVSTPAMRIQTAPAETVDYPAAMPSLPHAIAEHARLSGIDNAAASGADAANVAITEPHRGYNKQLQNSTASFLDQLNNKTPWSSPAAPMTDDEANAALGGVLARNKEHLGLTVKPWQFFSNNSSNVGPIIRALNARLGAPVSSDVLQNLIVSQGHPNP